MGGGEVRLRERELIGHYAENLKNPDFYIRSKQAFIKK